jgi:CheY-like chemotaxis protein
VVPDVNWQLDPSRLPVLVIEDNEETFFTYEKYFQGSNYQLIQARSLQETKLALEMFKPVAVISDILLKEQNTWNLISEMKQNEATRDIPLLVITVINNDKKALELGADAFFVKPIERLLLLDSFNKLINKKRQQKILIIDDDQVSRYLLKQLLAYTNFTILEAENGREGIRLAGEENPDCIFLDLAMPHMNGFEVIELLKSDRATSNIPVIINTSKVLEEEEKRDLARRTVAILSKDPSREDAIARSREALLKAGLVLEPGEKNHG